MDEQNNEFINEEINNEAINESDNNVVVETKKGNNKGFFAIFTLICIITIAFSAIAIKNDLSAKEDDSENVGEIYADIIKTMSQSSSNDEEVSIRDIATLTMNSIVEISTETVVWGSRLGQ